MPKRLAEQLESPGATRSCSSESRGTAHHGSAWEAHLMPCGDWSLTTYDQCTDALKPPARSPTTQRTRLTAFTCAFRQKAGDHGIEAEVCQRRPLLQGGAAKCQSIQRAKKATGCWPKSALSQAGDNLSFGSRHSSLSLSLSLSLVPHTSCSADLSMLKYALNFAELYFSQRR